LIERSRTEPSCRNLFRCTNVLGIDTGNRLHLRVTMDHPYEAVSMRWPADIPSHGPQEKVNLGEVFCQRNAALRQRSEQRKPQGKWERWADRLTSVVPNDRRIVGPNRGGSNREARRSTVGPNRSPDPLAGRRRYRHRASALRKLLPVVAGQAVVGAL
jgi:hypothetical protein